MSVSLQLKLIEKQTNNAKNQASSTNNRAVIRVTNIETKYNKKMMAAKTLGSMPTMP